MATLTTSKVASTVQSRTNVDLTAVWATYTLTAALALNDVIQMVKVPAGATILDMGLSCTDLDSGGTAIVLDVGDGSDTDRFIDGSAVGGTGGTSRIGSGITTNTHIGYTYTAEDTIDVLVQTGPTTGATSGTVFLYVLYSMNT